MSEHDLPSQQERIELRELQQILLEGQAINAAKERYKRVDEAVVGTTNDCPCCNKPFKKSTYHNRFCKSACKQLYWNLVDPKRRERAAHYSKKLKNKK